MHNLFAFFLKVYNNKLMNKKRVTILVGISVVLVGILAGYLFWANYRSDYYSKVSRETSDKQGKILALEKSVTLWQKPENISSLADLYLSIGRNDLAEQIIMDRGEVDILNKLGTLYLNENKVKEAENTFTKAKYKKVNSDSLKGLVLVELKKGDREVAEKYLLQLSDLDTGSANCYASFVYLNDSKKARDSFEKSKSCDLYDLSKYFATYREGQNPLYLKLGAVNKYYSENFLNLAEKDILALIKEKDDYRDAHTLAAKIYEKLGNQTKSKEEQDKAKHIDPIYH